MNVSNTSFTFRLKMNKKNNKSVCKIRTEHGNMKSKADLKRT